MPSHLALAPVEMISERARHSSSPAHTPNGRSDRSTRVAAVMEQLGLEAGGLLLHALHELGTQHGVGEAGEVLDLGGQHELAARVDALQHHGLQVGPGGVQGGGQTGGAGPQDDDVAFVHHVELHSSIRRNAVLFRTGSASVAYRSMRWDA